METYDSDLKISTILFENEGFNYHLVYITSDDDRHNASKIIMTSNTNKERHGKRRFSETSEQKNDHNYSLTPETRDESAKNIATKVYKNFRWRSVKMQYVQSYVELQTGETWLDECFDILKDEHKVTFEYPQGSGQAIRTISIHNHNAQKNVIVTFL